MLIIVIRLLFIMDVLRQRVTCVGLWSARWSMGKVSQDILSGYSEMEKGIRYVLVMVYKCFRLSELNSVPNKSAVTVTKLLVIIYILSTPKVILSDTGCEFQNAVPGELYRVHNIKKCTNIEYHPGCTKFVERMKRKVWDVIVPSRMKLSLMSSVTSIQF